MRFWKALRGRWTIGEPKQASQRFTQFELEELENRYLLSTFTVTTTLDSGMGSLRQAIITANATPGADTIEFNIGGGGQQTIQPQSPLPNIKDTLTIDGTSQPGFSGQPLIELDGSAAGANSNGLRIIANNSTVRGLVINRFAQHGILIKDGARNLIAGNRIGTNFSGTADLGNLGGGVVISGAVSNRIGGSEANERNLISGNDQYGVRILGTSNSNLVMGNLIGTTANGVSALGNRLGVLITSNLNRVGGSDAGEGNVISGNTRAGLFISTSSATDNIVLGNLIGTDEAGTSPLGNTGLGGLVISGGASSNQIGLRTDNGANVISGNDGAGVTIRSSSSLLNRLRGNLIGTDLTGTADLGNTLSGIVINDANSNRIGTANASYGNIISGNDASGVEIRGTAQGNWLQGNKIGTNASGTGALGNNQSGVLIDNAILSQIGRTGSDPNVISGNLGNGVTIQGASAKDNSLKLNLIGTDVNGTADLGNALSGVQITDSPDNYIGGSVATTDRNVISGNGLYGLSISGTTAIDNLVTSNFIGTDTSGDNGLPNDSHGVYISNASSNRIGGAGLGNLISGNSGDGVRITGAGATGNLVAGNLIGTKQNGVSDLGNDLSGVYISDASSNQIGGTAMGLSNTIAFNGGNGVTVVGASVDNHVLSNSIFSNVDLGIDLGGDGVTGNDAGDPDTGPNNLQNFPAPLSVIPLVGGDLQITYEIDSTPITNSTFPLLVQFFLTDADGEEGQTLIESDTYTVADQTAGPAKTITITPLVPVVAGNTIVATATDDNGTRNTSEFSASAIVNTPPTAVNDSYTELPVNVLLDAGGVTASGIEVNDADGVLSKDTDDSDADGDVLSVTFVQGTLIAPGGSETAATDGGGSVTMHSDGTFTYVSQAGETDPTDTFTYTISDGNGGVDNATVTITFTANTIWFIDDSAGAGGNGQSNDPFDTTTAFNAATTGTGDFVFLHTGTYNGTDGIDLLDSQQLIGEGAGITDGNFSVTAGTAPSLAPTADNGVNLASGNTIRGLDVGNTPGGHAFSGSAVGTLTIGGAGGNAVNVSGTGGIIEVTTSGNLDNVTFGTQTSASTAAASSDAAIDLTGISGTYTGGSPTISGSDGSGISITNSTADFSFTTVTIDGTAGSGIDILGTNTGNFTFGSGSSIGATTSPGSAGINIDGGGSTSNAQLTYSGDITQGTASQAAVRINNHDSTAAETITFQTGTISATDGTGLQFSNADGTYNFNGTTTLNGGDAGIDILDGSAGTFTFANTSITNPTGNGLNIDSSTAGVTFSGGSGISKNNAGAAVNVNDHSTGSVNIGVDINATGGTGLQFSNADGTYTFNTMTGTTTLNGGDAGIDILGGSAGTFTFSDTDITNPSGTGLNIDGSTAAVTYSGGSISKNNAGATFNVNNHSTGTIGIGVDINATGGTGLQFNNADGTYNFNTMTGTTTLNGGDAGIDITGSAGTFTFSDTDITDPSGIGLNIDTSTGGNVTLGGTITQNNAQSAVRVNAKTGGTVDINSLVTANTSTATGINLTSNTGGTINFNGGLNIDTTSGIGFNATGGGTVNVAATTGDESVTTTTGTAINITSTTIGGSGITFDSVSVNGATTGIVLNTTGTTGGLKVTGDGATSLGGNNSGGIIQNVTTGISLTSTSNASFRNMTIRDVAGDAVFGTGLTDGSGGTEETFEVLSSTFLDIGTAAATDNVFDFASADGSGTFNITGGLTLDNIVVDEDAGGADNSFAGNGLFVINNIGTTTINVTNSAFRNTPNTADQAINASARGVNTTNLTVTDSEAIQVRGEMASLIVEGSGAVGDLNFLRNEVRGNNSGGNSIGAGVRLAVNKGGTGTFDINDNTGGTNGFFDLFGDPIEVSLNDDGTNAGGSLEGRINNNTIDRSTDSPIKVFFDGDSIGNVGLTFTGKIEIDGNTVTRTGQNNGGLGSLTGAIDISVRDSNPAAMNSQVDVTITDNFFGIGASNYLESDFGIRANVFDTNATVNLLIDNTDVTLGASGGLDEPVLIRSRENATVNATVTNNILTNPNGDGFEIRTEDAGSTACLDIRSNTISNDLRIRENNGNLNVVQSAGDASTLNGSVTVDVAGTSPNFNQGGSCPQPVLPTNL